MTALNVAGSTFVARVQSLVVFIVVGILAVFAVVTIANADPALLAPSTYPGVRDIVSAVALTFFAFLGFGVVTFTASDLADPTRQLPRAMAIAIGIAAAIYIAVSIGVFGTLTVPEVIAAGPTAIAVAAQPVLGQAGYWLMTVTALFATAGATNAGLYPATGLSDDLASTGQFPDVMARRIGGGRPGRASSIAAAGILLLVVLFDLSAVASIGSAVALAIFALVTIGHLRDPGRHAARISPLLAACARHDRRHAADLRVHDAHPGAGLDPHARGDRRDQHRDRPVVGARQGATRRGGAVDDGVGIGPRHRRKRAR